VGARLLRTAEDPAALREAEAGATGVLGESALPSGPSESSTSASVRALLRVLAPLIANLSQQSKVISG
jgi:hypothetical protein